MADNRNLVLQLLITAKDSASEAFGNFFKFIDNKGSAVASQLREAFVGIFGGGLTAAADFEAQLDRVAAKGGYTGEEMENLKTKTALLGSQFGVTGTEAAKGMEALAAAGLNAADAIATLPPVLALAASEQISTEAAAQKLIDSLSIMGLGFDEAGRMADVLAKGANITTSSAAQLAEALTQAGGMARAAGMDLEETVAALDLLHKNGIKGAEAGTALKSILTSLLDPSSKASEELKKLGISSRDLGSVMAALEAKGGAAEAAILAFGTEAGPGLRALLAEGQGALDEMTLQLQNADGAAQDAADQMGGNLKTAIAGLNSAWESLKAAVAEPLLESIAKAANELTAAFQAALADGSIKGVQDLLKEFGTGIAENIKVAISSFDFKGATKAIDDFAVSAKGSFAGVQAAGVAASGAIQSAFNLITAPIKAVVGSMFQTIGNLFELLASVEKQAAKVGLGTMQTADELLRKAQAAKDSAADLRDAAKADIADLEEGAAKTATAFDGVAESIRKAREEAENPTKPDLGDAKSIELIKKSLEDYVGILVLTRAEQEKAGAAAIAAGQDWQKLRDQYDIGAVTLDEYNAGLARYRDAQELAKVATDDVAQAQRDVDVAMQEAIRGIDKESASVSAGLVSKKARYDATEKQLVLDQKIAEEIVKLANTLTVNAQAELALAKAKGDGNAITEAQLKLIQAEITAIQAKRAEQERELAQLQAKSERMADLLRRQDVLTNAEQAELELLKQQNPVIAAVIAAKQTEIDTTDRQIAAKERERRQAEIMAGPVGQLTRLYAEQAKEHQRTAEASERYQNAQVKEAEGALKLAQINGDAQEIDKAQAELNQQRINQAQAIASSRAQEAIDAEKALSAMNLELAADGELSKADQEKIANQQAVVEAKRAVASAAQQSVEQTREEIKATEEAAAAQDKAKSSADGLAASLAGMNKGARDAMGELSEQAKTYYDIMLGISVGQHAVISGFDEARKAESAFREGLSAGEKEIIRYRSEIIAADYAIKSADESLTLSTGNLGAYIDSMAKAAAQTKKAFYEQKIAAATLEESITKMSENGTLSMQALEVAAREIDGSFTLLDDQDLANLRSAMDDANAKLREMQQEAQDATARLAELNAEILAEQGNTAAADRLKLQIGQTQALTEIEQRLAEARALGNKELIAIYQQQIDKTKELYDLKNRNLEAEIAGNDKTTQTNKAAITQAGELAAQLERSVAAASALNSVPLDGIHSNLLQLNESVNALRSSL